MISSAVRARWAHTRVPIIALSLALIAAAYPGSAAADSLSSQPALLLQGSSVQPSALAFGSQLVRTQSATQQVAVTDKGLLDLVLSTKITAVQSSSPSFTIVSNGCAGVKLHYGSTCSVSVAFTPVAAGAVSGTLTIDESAGPSPLTVVLTGTGVAGEWEQFQGGAQHNGQANGRGPSAGPVQTFWSRTSNGTSFSSPVIGPDGTAYTIESDVLDAGCGPLSSAQDQIVALDPTGSPVWCHGLGGQQISSLALAPNGNLVAITTSGVTELDPTGAPIWERTMNAFGGGLTVGSDGSVYLEVGNVLSAFSAVGAQLWTTTLPTGTAAGGNTAPALSPDGSVVYAAGEGGTVSAFSTAGAMLWQHTIAGASLVQTPAVGPDGSVYLAATAAGTQPSEVVAISEAGATRWSYADGTGGPPITGAGGPITTPAVGSDGDLVFGDASGLLTALSESDGSLVWEHSGAIQGTATVPDYTAPPVIDSAGTIYIQTAEGLIADASDGTEDWFTTAFAGSSPLALDSTSGTLYVVGSYLSSPQLAALRSN